MRVLIVHNRYQQPGGEDAVFENEAALLAAHGCEVQRLETTNSTISAETLRNKVSVALNTVWNKSGYRTVQTEIQRFRPDVVHFHNTFPLISPAAYYAARAEGVPVVQTLHNYRLLCPNALLFRGDKLCEDCVGKPVSWPGVIRRCYRHSRSATAAVSAMTTAHRWMGTWKSAVGLYIALTEFAREKFIQGGLPADKVVVKPNFLHTDPGPGNHGGEYALFVGRLTAEKGVRTLLDAWEQIGLRLPLKVAGDGPLAGEVAARAQPGSGIEWVGHQPKERILALMKEAKLLLFPSLLYEGFPMVLVEAFAVGLPIIASNLGSMSALIHHGETGLLFLPGDHNALAKQVEWALANQAQVRRISFASRTSFERKYTAERNYEHLLGIYESVIKQAN